MSDSYYNIKLKADLARNIYLKEILKFTGALQDRLDKNKWHTPEGVISVTGTKFMNWNQCSGGGGAIDLAIHLNKCDFKTAVHWLCNNFLSSEIKTSERIDSVSKGALQPKAAFCAVPPGAPPSGAASPCSTVVPVKLPPRDNTRLTQVIHYLRYKRRIPLSLITDLIYRGSLYSDNRANAVFLLLGKEKRIVGAELRGTTETSWHGMSPGSRKDLGYFYITNKNPKKILICESAIDAISYWTMHPDYMTISTSGISPNPVWLKLFINNKGSRIYCGYDSDEAGNKLARQMIDLHPSVKRLRPPLHDWNDVLRATLNKSQ